jgi:hypothetical protein
MKYRKEVNLDAIQALVSDLSLDINAKFKNDKFFLFESSQFATLPMIAIRTKNPDIIEKVFKNPNINFEEKDQAGNTIEWYFNQYAKTKIAILGSVHQAENEWKRGKDAAAALAAEEQKWIEEEPAREE